MIWARLGRWARLLDFSKNSYLLGKPCLVLLGYVACLRTFQFPAASFPWSFLIKEKALKTRLNFLPLFLYPPITQENSSHRHISSIQIKFNFLSSVYRLLKEIPMMNVLPYYFFLLTHIVNTHKSKVLLLLLHKKFSVFICLQGKERLIITVWVPVSPHVSWVRLKTSNIEKFICFFLFESNWDRRHWQHWNALLYLIFWLSCFLTNKYRWFCSSASCDGSNTT